MSRALDEHSRARVLPLTPLCDLRQTVDISGSQNEGKKGLESSSLPRKQRKGVESSFLFIFLFSAQRA